MLALRGWRRAGVRLALATVFSAAPGARSALAQDGPPEAIHLDWLAPSGCPSGAEVRARVDRLLGGTPPASSTKREVASAVVSSDAGRWRLEVSTETAGIAGKRELAADTCRELAEAAALIVALAFDPEAVARTREAPAPAAPIATAPTAPVVTAPALVTGPLPSQKPEPPAPPLATAPPTVAPAVPVGVPSGAGDLATGQARPRRREDPIRVVGAALFSGGAGAMPEPALGFTASLGLANRLGRVELAGTYWLEEHGSAASRPAIGGDFSFMSGAASLCPTLLRGEFELAGCGGVELGRMHAAGTGVREPAEKTLVWVAARAGAAGTWRLDPLFGMRLELGAAIPFVRPRWVLGRGNEDVVDRPGVVDARAALGGEVRF